MNNKKNSPAIIGSFVLVAVSVMIAVILYYTADRFANNKQFYSIMFRSSTAGLDPGSPVVLQGVKIGEVSDIIVGFNQEIDQFEVQVGIVIERNKVRWPAGIPQENDDELRTSLMKKGLRAKLALHSLVTGKLMIQIDFYPDSNLVLAGLENEIPSTSSTSLNNLMEDVAALDIRNINEQIEKILNGIERIVNDGQIQTIENELLATLQDTRTIVHAIEKRIDPLANNLNNVLVNTQQLVSKVDSKIDPVSQSIIYAGTEVGDLSKVIGKEIIPALHSIKRAVDNVDSMIKKGSPVRVELVNALRNINKAALSLYEFAHYLERHPEALLKGKK